MSIRFFAGFGGGAFRQRVSGALIDSVILLIALLPSSAFGSANDETATTRPSAAPQRAIPSNDALAQAEKLVTEILGPRLSSASTLAERAELSAECFHIANETDEAPAKFALLVRAEGLAADARDVENALRVHGELASRFDLHGSPYGVALLQRLSTSDPNVTDAKRLCAATLDAADGAVAVDDYDSARQLTRIAGTLVHKSHDPKLVQRLASLSSTITALDAQQEQITASLTVLALRPDDPEANTIIGRSRCFMKHDWSGGLPMLAKGNDPLLLSLATRELDSGADKEQQLAVADSWWDYAEAQPATIRYAIRQHAGQWYAQVAPTLSGLTKLKAQRRASEFTTEISSVPSQPIVTKPKAPEKLLPAKKNGPTTNPTGGASDYSSLDAILAAIPIDLMPKPSEWQSDWLAREKFRSEYEHRFSLKRAICRIKIAAITPMFKDSMFVRSEKSAVGTAQLQINLQIPLTDPKLSALKVGQSLTVAGRFHGSMVSATLLELTLADCTFLDAPANPEPPSDKYDLKPRGFTDLASVLATIPPEFYPEKVEDWVGAPALKLSGEIFKRLSSKEGTFTVKVASVHPFSLLPMVTTENEMVGDVAVRLNLCFRGEYAAQLVALKPGESYVVTGTFDGASIGPVRKGPSGPERMKWLGFNMDNCRIVRAK